MCTAVVAFLVSHLTSRPSFSATPAAKTPNVREEVRVSKEQIDMHNAEGGMWAVLQDQVVVDLQMMTAEVGHKPINDNGLAAWSKSHDLVTCCRCHHYSLCARKVSAGEPPRNCSTG